MNVQRLLLSLACLFLFCSNSTAGVLEAVQKDFAPLAGVVVLPTGDEFLIDLDASKGVSAGDLFSVVVPGEKIVHPVTGEVIGQLDEKKGLLKVTRIKQGFSHTRALGKAADIARGDAIRRFENMTATFEDRTGRGAAFSAALQQALPGLEWQESEADILFLLKAEGLAVRDAEANLLHSYPLPEGLTRAVPAPPKQSPIMLDKPAAGAISGGVRYELSFPGFVNVGELNGTTLMADFIRPQGRLLMASTDGRTIRVQSVSDNLTDVASARFEGAASVLGVQWWQPEADGPPYLAVSTWSGDRLSGTLLRLDGNQLVKLKDSVPYLLGSFDRDGDGRSELLLGQEFSREGFFGPRIRALTLVDEQLKGSSPSFELPRRFTVTGSTFADLTGNGQPETVTVRHGFVYVFSGKKRIFKSPKQAGGSLSSASWETIPDSSYSQLDHAPIEVAPQVADIDGDGILELVTVSSDRSAFRAGGFGTPVKKSWIGILKFRDGLFVTGKVGEELDVPLQGITVDGDRILFVASRPGSLTGKGGGSNLLSIGLAR